MITSQKQLQRELSKKKSKLKDEDIFFSSAYANMLLTMQHGIVDTADNGRIYVEKADPNTVAYTDSKETHINYDFTLLQSLKDKVKKHLFILGTTLHEFGHKLFTDFKLDKSAREALERGSIYPMPTGNKYLEETLKALNSGDFKMATSLTQIYHKLANIIEDGFVNRAVSALCPGYGSCLKYSYEVTADSDFNTLKEMRDAGEPDHEILLSMIFMYCVYSKYCFDIEEESDDDLKKAFIDLQNFLNKAVFEARPIRRMQLVNDVFCYVYHFIKEEAEKKDKENEEKKNDEKEKSSSQSNKGNGNSSGSGSSNPPSGDNSSSQPSQSGNSQETQNGSPNQNGSSNTLNQMLSNAAGNMKTSEKSEHSEKMTPNAEAINKAEKAMGDNSTQQTESKSEGGASEAAKQLDSVAKGLAMEQLSKEQENAIKKQNQTDVKNIDREPVHKDHPGIIRRAEYSEAAKREYDNCHAELDVIVRRFMKEFEKELKDLQLGDNLTGLYAGKRLDTNHLYREDKRIFSQKQLPVDVPDMAVGILVDCSGSMSGDKIEIAKRTAYITYKFCEKLNIPVFVVGHSTAGRNVILNCVADERSIDSNDQFRIFDLAAGGSNRDGYALRFCLNRLKTMEETDRLMLVISDGLPAHDGYGKEAGRKDCQAAVHDAIKVGITTIAAGLGSDANNIRSVYQQGRSKTDCAAFLDISDIVKLPKAFIKIIKERLKKSA